MPMHKQCSSCGKNVHVRLSKCTCGHSFRRKKPLGISNPTMKRRAAAAAAAKIANETVEEKRQRQETDRRRKALRRAMETEEERRKRRESERKYKALRRSMESEEQKKIHQEASRQYQAYKRASESEEQKEARREASRRYKALQRANESEEQKEARREAGRRYKAFKRASESEEQKEAHREASRRYQALKRSMESEEQKAINREASRKYQALRRSLKAEKQASMRRETSQEYRAFLNESPEDVDETPTNDDRNSKTPVLKVNRTPVSQKQTERVKKNKTPQRKPDAPSTPTRHVEVNSKCLTIAPSFVLNTCQGVEVTSDSAKVSTSCNASKEPVVVEIASPLDGESVAKSRVPRMASKASTTAKFLKERQKLSELFAKTLVENHNKQKARKSPKRLNSNTPKAKVPKPRRVGTSQASTNPKGRVNTTTISNRTLSSNSSSSSQNVCNKNIAEEQAKLCRIIKEQLLKEQARQLGQSTAQAANKSDGTVTVVNGPGPQSNRMTVPQDVRPQVTATVVASHAPTHRNSVASPKRCGTLSKAKKTSPRKQQLKKKAPIKAPTHTKDTSSVTTCAQNSTRKHETVVTHKAKDKPVPNSVVRVSTSVNPPTTQVRADIATLLEKYLRKNLTTLPKATLSSGNTRLLAEVQKLINAQKLAICQSVKSGQKSMTNTLINNGSSSGTSNAHTSSAPSLSTLNTRTISHKTITHPSIASNQRPAPLSSFPQVSSLGLSLPLIAHPAIPLVTIATQKSSQSFTPTLVGISTKPVVMATAKPPQKTISPTEANTSTLRGILATQKSMADNSTWQVAMATQKSTTTTSTRQVTMATCESTPLIPRVGQALAMSARVGEGLKNNSDLVKLRVAQSLLGPSKMAFNWQLERKILTAPYPKASRQVWPIIPSTGTSFITNYGLECVAEHFRATQEANYQTSKTSTPKTNPVCKQCGCDFASGWVTRTGKSSKQVILCEACDAQNLKALRRHKLSNQLSELLTSVRYEEEMFNCEWEKLRMQVAEKQCLFSQNSQLAPQTDQPVHKVTPSAVNIHPTPQTDQPICKVTPSAVNIHPTPQTDQPIRKVTPNVVNIHPTPQTDPATHKVTPNVVNIHPTPQTDPATHKVTPSVVNIHPTPQTDPATHKVTPRVVNVHPTPQTDPVTHKVTPSVVTDEATVLPQNDGNQQYPVSAPYQLSAARTVSSDRTVYSGGQPVSATDKNLTKGKNCTRVKLPLCKYGSVVIQPLSRTTVKEVLDRQQQNSKQKGLSKVTIASIEDTPSIAVVMETRSPSLVESCKNRHEGTLQNTN